MGNRGKICPPFQLPTLGQGLAPSGHPSLENDPTRREPFPVNPSHLVTGFRSVLVLFISRTKVGLLIPMEGRSCGRFKLRDPCDASSDLHGGFDPVLCMPGGLVDKCGSEGRVSLEPECAAAHLGVVVVITEARAVARYACDWRLYWGDTYRTRRVNLPGQDSWPRGIFSVPIFTGMTYHGGKSYRTRWF